MSDFSKFKIQPAQISWRDGSAFSEQFDDIYFIPQKGVEESKYVFLEGCQLKEKFQSSQSFTIGELGFGSGLNFLLAAELFSSDAPKGASLDYFSIEKHPLKLEDMDRILSDCPVNQDLKQELLSKYPPLHYGFHSIWFEKTNIRLILMFGEALDMLKGMNANVNAWFLDGFAPAKNPEMWSSELCKELSRLSANHSILSSFTASGMVRRNLAENGFEVERIKGFGRKTHMIRAVFSNLEKKNEPVFPPQKRVSIIGGGVAGCTTAYYFKKMGCEVKLYEKEENLFAGASGNPLAKVQARLTADLNLSGQFGATAFLHTLRLYEELEQQGFAIWQGQRGCVEYADNEEKEQRFDKFIERGALPTTEMQFLDPEKTGQITGLNSPNKGLFFPQGGCVNNMILSQALSKNLRVQLGQKVSFQRENEVWILTNEKGEIVGEADILILANAYEIADFFPKLRNHIFPNRGQLTYIPEETFPNQIPISNSIYVSTPFLWNGQKTKVLGASYQRLEEIKPNDFDITEADHIRNLEKLSSRFSHYQNDIDKLLSQVSALSGRVSFRATTKGALPVVGQMSDEIQGLFMISGLGSRGFQTASLCADILVSLALKKPIPVSSEIIGILSPQRFKD